MKIFLTGSSGYIGSALVPLLQKRGDYVIGIDRQTPKDHAPDLFIQGELLDDGVIEDALPADTDCILHLAAARTDWGLSDEEYYKDNLEVTQQLLKVGRKKGIKNWFFYSTVGVMGPSENPLDESAPYAALIAYGASKAEAEKLFYKFSEEDPEASIVMLRPSAVFSPGNPSNTNIFRLVEAIQNDRFMMIGNGNQYKTTSFLGNLLPATLFLMEQIKPGIQTYIYVDSPVLTTAHLIDSIYKYIDKKKPQWYLPLWFVKPLAYTFDVAASVLRIDLPITAARIEKFCTSTNYDPSALRQLGFQQPIPIEDALRATVEWHLNQ